MKCKQNESVPLHFLAREPLKHTEFVSLNTCTRPNTCSLQFVRRFLSTGAEDETGIDLILHWLKNPPPQNNDSNIPVS